MASKKKPETILASDLVPSLGDNVTVISPTIFDDRENLSDLLMTGLVTALNPAPGWDYEVTFEGELSLDGREKIKTRLYNKHQIAKNVNELSLPNCIKSDIGDALYEEKHAVFCYNQSIQDLKDIKRHMSSEKRPERLLEMIIQRGRHALKLVDEEKRVKDARKRLAKEIRSLLAEYHDDKTSV